MATQTGTNSSGIGAKNWIAIISALASVVAIIPPIISALRANPSVTQGGIGNTTTVGSTLNSNNTIYNTYVTMWLDGVKSLVGVGPKPEASRPITSTPFPVSPTLPTPQSALPIVSADPEPGAVGRIVTNASLINEATWTAEPSRVTRVLTLYFHAEAAGEGDKIGSLDATLFREGKDICTISLNSKTSPLSSGVRLGDATCHDTLPANSGATYRAKIKALELAPVKVVLAYVDAVKK